MKQIIVTTQEQLDKISKVEKEEELIINAELRLNCIVEVFGKLFINCKVNCSWLGRYFRAWGNATVRAWGNATVEAWGNATVEAWGNATVRAWGNATVEAWENAVVRLFSELSKIVLYGFSVCMVRFDLKCSITKKSKTAYIQKIKDLDWFERNAVEKKAKVILYKKVSKDFKTQEGTCNETLWEIGKTLTHPNWQPENGECGEGKFHACSRPYFCDEFRSEPGDRYIAIEVKLKDLYEWKDNPDYPHKIGFREGKVIYECDSFGMEKVDK